MKRDWVLLGLMAAVMGCGDDMAPPVLGGGRLPEEDASRSEKDAEPGSDLDAGLDAGPVMENTGPMLSFTSPAPAMDPSDEAVWVRSAITVRCKAMPRSSSARVDASSIRITMEKTGTASTEMVVGAVDALGGDEYEAEFDVNDMPNGPLRFQCQAKDLGTVPGSSSIAFATLLDLGPTVEIVQPAKPEYALLQPVPIQFKVLPSPVGDGDEKAVVKQVKLEVSGVPIAVTEAEDEPGVYRTDVDFENTALFMVTPTNAEVLVTASNDRAPVAPVRAVKRNIRIDADGPTIVVEKPSNGEITRGTEDLHLRISDPAGVKAGSVNARFENVLKTPLNGDLLIERWEGTAPMYTALFDTGGFIPTINQVTIQITAQDGVGNSNTIDHSFYVDNVPPILSLDPPTIREWRESTNATYCSASFDPLGDAVSDLQSALSFVLPRVLIEDQTNRMPDQRVRYHAGVAQDKVKLFVQGDPSQPFLKDTNEDGICDEIETNLGDHKPTERTLRFLTPRGASWFPKTLTGSLPAWCGADPSGADTPPNSLCDLTVMSRAVHGRSEGKPSAVFALDPTDGTTGECAGREWLVGPIVGEGWACFAARAEDVVGNVGVSPPIRVCFDDGNGTSQPCLLGASDPDLPDCTHNCTIAGSQIYPADMVWDE